MFQALNECMSVQNESLLTHPQTWLLLPAWLSLRDSLSRRASIADPGAQAGSHWNSVPHKESSRFSGAIDFRDCLCHLPLRLQVSKSICASDAMALAATGDAPRAHSAVSSGLKNRIPVLHLMQSSQ